MPCPPGAHPRFRDRKWWYPLGHVPAVLRTWCSHASLPREASRALRTAGEPPVAMNSGTDHVGRAVAGGRTQRLLRLLTLRALVRSESLRPLPCVGQCVDANATAAYRGHQSAFPARRCRGKTRRAANTRVKRAASRAPTPCQTPGNRTGDSTGHPAGRGPARRSRSSATKANRRRPVERSRLILR